MTEQDKQALIKHFCSRDCGEAAENCPIMPCWEIELIQEFPTTEPDADTIRRQAVISAICNACGKIDCDKMDKCEKLQLPPASSSEFPNNSDTISRAKAIEALRKMQTYKLFSGDDMLLIDQAGAQTELMMLPPAQPEIVRCKDCLMHGACRFERGLGLDGYCSQAERRTDG